MAQTVFKFPSANALVSAGDAAWANPANANADDAAVTTASPIPKNGGVSELRRWTGFGFTTADIPAGSTIDGIEVEIECGSPGGTGITVSANIFDATNGAGTAQVSPSIASPGLSVQAFGGITDLFGNTSISDADVRASTFGVQIQATNTSATQQDEACDVDFIRVRINYTAPGESASGGGTIAALTAAGNATVGGGGPDQTASGNGDVPALTATAAAVKTVIAQGATGGGAQPAQTGTTQILEDTGQLVSLRSVNYPTGRSADSDVILFMVANNFGSIPNTPAGWTSLYSATLSSVRIDIYGVADTGQSGTFTLTSDTGAFVGICTAVENCSLTEIKVQGATSASPWNCPNAVPNTSPDNLLAFAIGANGADQLLIVPSSGYTQDAIADTGLASAECTISSAYRQEPNATAVDPPAYQVAPSGHVVTLLVGAGGVGGGGNEPTIPALTASGTASVGAPPTASGNGDVPALTAAGAASIRKSASGAASIAALEAAGAALRRIAAAGAAQVPALTASGAAKAGKSAAGGATVPALTAAGAASVRKSATGDATLGALTGSGSAEARKSASGAASIPALTATAAAVRTVLAEGGGGSVTYRDSLGGVPTSSTLAANTWAVLPQAIDVSAANLLTFFIESYVDNSQTYLFEVQLGNGTQWTSLTELTALQVREDFGAGSDLAQGFYIANPDPSYTQLRIRWGPSGNPAFEIEYVAHAVSGANVAAPEAQLFPNLAADWNGTGATQNPSLLMAGGAAGDLGVSAVLGYDTTSNSSTPITSTGGVQREFGYDGTANQESPWGLGDVAFESDDTISATVPDGYCYAFVHITAAPGGATLPALTGAGTATLQAEQPTASGAADVPALTATGAAEVRRSASGAATVPSLTALGAAARRLAAAGSADVPSLTAAGVARRGSNAAGAGDVPALQGAGSASVRKSASGGASVPALTGSGSAEARKAASGGASVPALTAAGVARVRKSASGGASVPALTGAGFASFGEKAASGAADIPALLAAAAAKVRRLAGGGAAIPALEASGAARIGRKASGSATTPPLTASGGAQARKSASGAASIPALQGAGTATVQTLAISASGAADTPALLAAGLARIRRAAAGAATITALTAAGTATVRKSASGAAEVPSLTGAGIATGPGPDSAFGAADIPTLQASGAARVRRSAVGAGFVPSLTADGITTRRVSSAGAATITALTGSGFAERRIAASGSAFLPSLFGSGFALVGGVPILDVDRLDCIWSVTVTLNATYQGEERLDCVYTWREEIDLRSGLKNPV